MTAAKPRRTKPKEPSAQNDDNPVAPPLIVVTPAVGQPWTGEIVDVLEAHLGGALINAAADALRDNDDPDKYTIVRCLKAGDNKGLKEGEEYLVLSWFVHKI